MFDVLERRQLLAGVALASSADVGSTSLPGDYAFSNGQHSLDATGNDIGNAADSFRFAWTTVAQDLTLGARIQDFTSPNVNAKAGVMLRNSVNAQSAMASVVVLPDARVQFIYRLTMGSTAGVASVTDGNAKFIRLVRVGFGVSGSYSDDGIQWNALGSPQRIAFDSGASQAGLAIAAHSSSSYASATFANVSITQGLLTQNDIGPSTTGGSANYDAAAGTTTVYGDGSGFGSTSDGITFASTPLDAAASVVARVNSSSAGTDAGVMVRATNAPGAAFAAVIVNSTGVRFAYRTASGAMMRTIAATSATVPVSVKIVRDGNAVQGYYSADGGASWTRIGSLAAITLDLPAKPLAGLVASSTAVFTGVSIGAVADPRGGVLTTTDEGFLDDLSHRTANWFLATQNTTSGLFPDRANVSPGWLGGDSSMASTGFGLSALVIAASRGWITDGYDRALKTLNFLWSDADLKNPANHGFFYHFVNQTTGVRSGTSELSSIDTALLVSGVLTAGQYWKGTPLETLATQIYDRVDWTFMQPDGAGTQLRMAWTPESGFSAGRWDSWSEGPLLYLLALGSNTHAVNAGTWLSFPRYQTTVTYAGMTFYAASGTPLFTNQYPQAWFDLRNKADLADADPGAGVVHLDPFINSKKHTLAQREASIDAAAGSDTRYDYYGANAWGLTASDSATGYKVFGGPPLTSNVDGTIAPTAPGGSLAFTPRESIDDLQNLKTTYPNSYKTYGFVDAFNPRPSVNWYDPDAIGIDQGMLLVAAENLRTGLIWNTFMQRPEAQRAVSLAFTADAATAAPAIASSTFSYQTGQSLTVNFAADVADSFDASDIDIVNITTGQAVAPAMWTLSRTGAGKPTAATVTFLSPLEDGNYEVRFRSNGLQTTQGVTNLQPLVASFFVLAGDANRDRVVDFNDLVILAQNYGQSGRGFGAGNFDYSTDGVVNFNDLVILAQRYGRSLAATIQIISPGSTKDRRSPLLAELR